MPSWSELLQLLNTEAYDPALPPAAPKPPGYWAMQKLRSGNPLEWLSILPGIVGSGLQKYSEEVPQRVMSAGQEFAPDIPGITPQYMKDYRERLRSGQDHVEAAKDLPIIPSMVMQTLSDPTTYLGGWVKSVPGVGGKILQGVERAVNLPGEKIFQGMGKMAKGVTQVTPSNWWDRSPASKAQEQFKDIHDLISTSPGIIGGIMDPIQDVGQYSVPMRGGQIDFHAADEAVAQGYKALEAMIDATPDAMDKTWKAQLLRSMKAYTSEARDLWGGRLGEGQVDQGDIQYGAWAGWFDQTRRAQDALAREFEAPLPSVFTQQGLDELGLPTPVVEKVANLTSLANNLWVKTVGDTNAQVNAIRKLVNEGGMGRDEGRQLVNQLYHQRDTVVQSIQDDLLSLIHKEIPTHPEGAEALASMASKTFLDRLQGFQKQQYDIPEGAGIIPSRLQKSYDETAPIFGREVMKVVGDRYKLVDIIRKSIRGKPEVRSGITNLGQAWNYIRNIAQDPSLPNMGEGLDIKVFTDTLNKVYKARPDLFDLEALTKVSTLLEKYGDTDILQVDPLKLAMPKAQSRYELALRGKPYKMDQTLWDKIIKQYGTRKRAYSQHLILNPGFMALNIVSALGASALHSPEIVMPAMKNMLENFSISKLGLEELKPDAPDLLPTSIKQHITDYGVGIPAAVDVNQLANTTSYVLNKAKLAPEDIHPLERAITGAITAPLDPISMATNAVWSVGAGTGSKYNPLKMLQHVMQGTEAGIRMAMWKYGMDEKVQEWFPQFLEEVNKRLSSMSTRTGAASIPPEFTVGQAAPVAPTLQELPSSVPSVSGGLVGSTPPGPLGPTAGTSLVPSTLPTPGLPITGGEYPMGIWAKPQAKQELLAELQSTGGKMDQKYLQDTLRKYGILQQDIPAIAQEWVDLLDEASEYGVSIANKYQVDYSHFSNLEEWVAKFVPFTRWPIHMTPVILQTVLENPALMLAINRLNNLTREDAEELGLPEKYEDTIPVGGIGNWILEQMVGREGDTRLDPTRLLPYSSFIPDTKGTQFSQGPLETALEAAPIQLYPQYQLGLQGASALANQLGVPTGMMSPTKPLPSFNRYGPMLTTFSNLLRGLPGMNQIPRGASSNVLQPLVENTLPFWQPYSYERAAIQRRLGEMAGEETGYVDHPLYQAAKGLSAGPLYEQAEQDVLRQRGVEGTIGTLLPGTVRFLPKTEQDVYGARRNLPTGPLDTPEKLKGYQEALGENPAAAMHTGTSGTKVGTELEFALTARRNPAVLFPEATPKVAEDLMKGLIKYDDAKGMPGQRNVLIENPLVAYALQKRELVLKQYPILSAWDFWRKTYHPELREEGEEGLKQQFLDWYTREGQNLSE